MLEILASFVGFGTIVLLAAMSPGPDFLVVSKNAVSHSRRIGMFTAIGIGAGILVHVAYSVAGIGLIISQSILLYSVIKWLGAAYLVYLGVTLLWNKHTVVVENHTPVASTKTAATAFREGFLTNVLNPKATIFFLSVFSQILSPDLPAAVQSLYGIEAAVVAAVWFSALSYFLTHKLIAPRIGKIQEKVLKVMGAALVLLGVKVALSR